MINKFTLIAGLAALFAMGSAPAKAACPTNTLVATAINDETGHTFFLYKALGITWDQAQECVAALPQVGALNTTAHLATITSSSENAWIVTELLTGSSLTLTQVWVGGSQTPGSDEPGEGWRWVNNEGQIPVPGSTVTLGYSNWQANEPNNTGGTSVNERHLTLGRYADLGLWNDEGASPASIGGFLVEYDTPRTSTAGCSAIGNTTACDTVDGQTLTFPPGTFTGDSSFTFTAYEFTDPRVVSGRCVGIKNVRGPLTLFTDDSFNLPNTPSGSQSGKLVIPAYLCGSPKFLVIRAQGTNITIPRGVVVTESATNTILSDNLFACDAPIPAGISPQQQDVGVWQSLDPTEMWEDDTTQTSPYAGFAPGTAAELTTACGSTLIKTRTKSNFVVGLHIDFGDTVNFGSPAEYNEMVALTQYKISLVKQSVAESRTAGIVSNSNARAMIAQLDNASKALVANNPVSARDSMIKFLQKVNFSKYVVPNPTSFNYNGDHLSRGENIQFTLDHKVIPFKPVP